ncbi:MAG: DUF3035 domain-containing protein [Acetobacteraceae bacterium]
MARFGRHLPPASIVLLCGALLPLGACSLNSSDLSRTFGLTRDSPDEFAVTTQAPLSMPPDFSIRAPQPGASRPQSVPESVAAQQALIPQTTLAAPDNAMSPGQQALVAEAGPAASSRVRAEIAQDAAKNYGTSFADRLMFWRNPVPQGIAVDPTREAQRLRENAALGQSPEIGQTPIIQPRPRGWLQGIF